MRTQVFTSVALVAVVASGCLGDAGALPGDLTTVSFTASGVVEPAAPRPGQPVSVRLEVVSASNTDVVTDVTLRVVDGQGRQVSTRTWEGVLFHPEEIWDLSNDFNPPSDAYGADWKVQLTVADARTGALLHEQPELMRVSSWKAP